MVGDLILRIFEFKIQCICKGTDLAFFSMFFLYVTAKELKYFNRNNICLFKIESSAFVMMVLLLH